MFKTVKKVIDYFKLMIRNFSTLIYVASVIRLAKDW